MINILVFVLLVGGIVVLDLYLEKQRDVKFKARIKKQHEDVERLRALVSDVSSLLAPKRNFRQNKGPNIFSLSSSLKVEAQNIFINVYNPEVLTPEQLTALSGSSTGKTIEKGEVPKRLVVNYSETEPLDFENLFKRLHVRDKKPEY